MGTFLNDVTYIGAEALQCIKQGVVKGFVKAVAGSNALTIGYSSITRHILVLYKTTDDI